MNLLHVILTSICIVLTRHKKKTSVYDFSILLPFIFIIKCTHKSTIYLTNKKVHPQNTNTAGNAMRSHHTSLTRVEMQHTFYWYNTVFFPAIENKIKIQNDYKLRVKQAVCIPLLYVRPFSPICSYLFFTINEKERRLRKKILIWCHFVHSEYFLKCFSITIQFENNEYKIVYLLWIDANENALISCQFYWYKF